MTVFSKAEAFIEVGSRNSQDNYDVTQSIVYKIPDYYNEALK